MLSAQKYVLPFKCFKIKLSTMKLYMNSFAFLFLLM